jgi:glycosyltransferase involved in cell wall biosynthesis
MKIVLATGIYPPDIGGPATYSRALATGLVMDGTEVVVVTYGEGKEEEEGWKVVRVPLGMCPFCRWWRYAKALKKHAADADIVEAFSSVSVGVPLWLARLKKPKKILRLGGDFFWERYTARGGKKGLKAWYASTPPSRFLTKFLLHRFHHIILSTRWQEQIYEKHFRSMPTHSVIENSLPSGTPKLHVQHQPLRLLFIGRFVGFKNLMSLLKSLVALDNVTLTMVGHGPMHTQLVKFAKRLEIQNRITFVGPRHGSEKEKLFSEHDVLIIPSITEISPNIALEARASGLPVLLTQETGLSAGLTEGMILSDLGTSSAIASSVAVVQGNYEKLAKESSQNVPERSWENVTKEHMGVFLSE